MSKMDREKVTSSNIVSIGYDEPTKILEVEFKGGGVYQYEDVPQEVYFSLLNATSVGQYFNSNIRTAYVVTKV